MLQNLNGSPNLTDNKNSLIADNRPIGEFFIFLNVILPTTYGSFDRAFIYNFDCVRAYRFFTVIKTCKIVYMPQSVIFYYPTAASSVRCKTPT